MHALQCCGSGIIIPNPGSEFFHPKSRIPDQKDSGSAFASKNSSIFNPNNASLALGNMIRDAHPGSGY
jgi:hypothetical protein